MATDLGAQDRDKQKNGEGEKKEDIPPLRSRMNRREPKKSWTGEQNVSSGLDDALETRVGSTLGEKSRGGGEGDLSKKRPPFRKQRPQTKKHGGVKSENRKLPKKKKGPSTGEKVPDAGKNEKGNDLLSTPGANPPAQTLEKRVAEAPQKPTPGGLKEDHEDDLAANQQSCGVGGWSKVPSQPQVKKKEKKDFPGRKHLALCQNKKGNQGERTQAATF